MRIVIASTYVPFIKGGGTMIVDSLQQALIRHGYDVDTVLIPLRSYWAEVPAQTIALRCLDLTHAAGNPIDRLITIRYPSYAIPHPNKVVWFIHHHRGAYDLWGTEYQDIPNTPEGIYTRQLMINADNLYLREAKRVYTNSLVVAERLRKFNNLEPNRVLFPPLPNPELYSKGEAEDYFIYSARIAVIKRQALAIEAMQYVKSDFKLLLVGKGDMESYMLEMQQLAQKLNVHHKVRFAGWVSEEEKASLTANAIAALYIAFDEDSYGYSTLEAFHSHKAVVTCTDSGGTHDVIEDGVNGRIVEPTPQALAAAMEELWANKQRTAQMGENAFATIERYGITWDRVVEELAG